MAAALELRDLPSPDSPGLDVLRRLVPYLPEPLLEEALDTALWIEDEEVRARTLEILAPYLPDSLLEAVLEAAALIEDEETRAEILTNMALYLPESLMRLALPLKPLWAMGPWVAEPTLKMVRIFPLSMDFIVNRSTKKVSSSMIRSPKVTIQALGSAGTAPCAPFFLPLRLPIGHVPFR